MTQFGAIQHAAQSAPQQVVKAVQSAASATGINFDYLMQKAATESSFNTTAKASTSSATGLYQFIDSTWLGMVRDVGDKYGLGNLADKIDSNGKVTDAKTRDTILNLRNDPKMSAIMAAEFTKNNQDHLAETVGGKIGDTELYLAHFLGAGGAEKFLNAMHKNPNQPAAALLPDAARANKNVFFNKDNGSALSLQQIYNRFARKFDEAPSVFTEFAASDIKPTPHNAAPLPQVFAEHDDAPFMGFTPLRAPGAAPVLSSNMQFDAETAHRFSMMAMDIVMNLDNPLNRPNDKNRNSVLGEEKPTFQSL